MQKKRHCGIITAKRLLYHAHIASPRRCAEISWRAVRDGTCQLYHKALCALWYNTLKMNARVHFVYGGRLPPIAAAQRMRPGNEFPVAWRSSACGHRFFVVQYPQGGYRTTCISPLRGDAINFMACRRRRHMPIVP